MDLKKGDIKLHKFSPTGFYSSAVKNNFIKELTDRSFRQIKLFTKSDEASSSDFSEYALGKAKRPFLILKKDISRVKEWIKKGFSEVLKTPDNSIIFVSPEKAEEIKKDQRDCMGCLSHCSFSNWADKGKISTGRKVDPRSFCIQKTLQDVAHEDDVDNQLMFAGHNAWKFSQDPFYSNGFVPSVKQLVDRIVTGS